ncbi:hypothetical protein M8C21_011384 [Ambrosia artemisiifolia]|uniref:ARID domain-containing protein n=1 Tax=Ambrosia artemisiifolia TaxID=4212 RepID=A0AAD5BPN0_AMBAR|nr:hypothetical protein M8C21_011384 [Ambrosia artemisiifolia]
MALVEHEEGEGIKAVESRKSLWRSVIRLGGYEQVTSCKFWRQIGESFKPPK